MFSIHSYSAIRVHNILKALVKESEIISQNCFILKQIHRAEMYYIYIAIFKCHPFRNKLLTKEPNYLKLIYLMLGSKLSMKYLKTLATESCVLIEKSLSLI